MTARRGGSPLVRSPLGGASAGEAGSARQVAGREDDARSGLPFRSPGAALAGGGRGGGPHPPALGRTPAAVPAEEAEAAVRALLRWIGEDPGRPGLRGTPGRVARAWEEWFGGYGQDPAENLRTTFDETGGYDEVVLLGDVGFVSHCEHHLAPIVGKAHVAYLPDRRVVGISKLARVVDVFARRLQIQERMTAQVADTIQEVLEPRGWRW